LNKEFYACSEGITIPSEYVLRAEQRGFDKTTVAQVMYEAGVIENAKDPHLSLTGVPRKEYIKRTLESLLKSYKLV